MHIQTYRSRRIPVFGRISVESNRKKAFAFRGSPLGCPAGTPDITFSGLNSSLSPTSIAPHSHRALHLPILCRATRARHTGGVLDSLHSFPPSQHQALPSMPPSMLFTPLQRLCSRCGSLQLLGLPPAWQPPDCHPRCSQVSPL